MLISLTQSVWDSFANWIAKCLFISVSIKHIPRDRYKVEIKIIYE